jgi:RNA polymerase sigma factor (sigma-70 family)
VKERGMERRESTSTSSCECLASHPGLVNPTVTQLVACWQETGCHVVFERLVREVRPEVERSVERTLWRRGVRDPAAADDAVALVLDHLRRLPGGHASERHVAKFEPRVRRGRHGADLGRSYIGRLAQDRAIDVVRSLRRRKSLPFSQFAADGGRSLEEGLEAAAAENAIPLIDRLRDALVKLEPRQRMLVELLIVGKSQAVIAHVLGLSEGTVSRLRVRAIATLRRLLADE